MALLRRWDRSASERVDLFVANSGNVTKRIKRFYDRDALVVHPPVQLERFHASKDIEDFYLVVSRLVAYKRVDLAVEACTRSGRRLLVLGDGPDRARLEAMAGPSVSFLGRVDDQRVTDLLSTCRALLFCGEEDFGITPLEAMASGRPVIALGRGGALETVVDRVTGLFFSDSTVEALETAISALEASEFDPQACMERANEFGPERFRKGILEAMDIAAGQEAPAVARQRRGGCG
jgi:glycosyltransferase involved in cell wall biosynthesis